MLDKQILYLKLKHIFLPLLIYSIITILLYVGLRWLLDIRLAMLPIQQEVWDKIIPMLLTLGILFIGMRPRLQLINFKMLDEGGKWIFYLSLFLALIGPITLSQSYLTKVAYPLIHVAQVDDIHNHPKQKFFQIEQFNPQDSPVALHVTSKLTGKYNDNLRIYLYLATPLSLSDNIWLGKRHPLDIDNTLDAEQKEQQVKQFIDDTVLHYKPTEMTPPTYFEKLDASADKEGYLHAVWDQSKQGPPSAATTYQTATDSGSYNDSNNNNADNSSQSLIILEARFDDLSLAAKDDLQRIIRYFIIGMTVYWLLIVIATFDKAALDKFQSKAAIDDSVTDLLALLDLKGKMPATALLLIATIIVFMVAVLMGMDLMHPTADQLFKVGGLNRQALVDGQYWRLLSSVMIHGGLVHLVMNLFWLTLVGFILEPVMKGWRFLITFALCGLAASMANSVFYDVAISVGASGAIFGLFAVALVLLLGKIYVDEDRLYYGFIISGFLGVSAMTWLLGLTNNIGHVAHITGFLVGLLLGLILVMSQRQFLLDNAQKQTCS